MNINNLTLLDLVIIGVLLGMVLIVLDKLHRRVRAPAKPAVSGTKAAAGALLVIGAILAGYFFLFYDTRAPGTEVVNLSRLSDRQNGVVIGVGTAILGGILLGVGKRN